MLQAVQLIVSNVLRRLVEKAKSLVDIRLVAQIQDQTPGHGWLHCGESSLKARTHFSARVR
jgi:hypothetical protein